MVSLVIDGGKSPVGVYKKGGGVTVFLCFQNNSYRVIRRDEVFTWLIFHLFGNLSDNN